MISELVDSIEIFPIGFANTLLMFGSIKEEMRKYNPKKNMKFPRTTGYGFLTILLNMFAPKYAAIMTIIKANAAYWLRLKGVKPIVGATTNILTTIDKKQQGHGAIIAIAAVLDVFFSCIFHSLIVNTPEIIIIAAIIRKNPLL